jgi:hypothetical protein
MIFLRHHRWGLFALVPLLSGCDDTGVLVSPVALEPLEVQNGTFFPGPLPTGTGPKVDNIFVQQSSFAAGANARTTLNGDADVMATAVLLRFADLGSGYWSVPVGIPETAPGVNAVTWLAVPSYSPDIPVGSHTLVFNAIDANGNAGPAPGVNQMEVLTFRSNVPQGDVVVSLAWDSNADLDLHLVAPDGTELDPQHPTTAAMLEADGGLPPGTAVLDRDSNANCVEDPFREEDAVFATRPKGTYVVRVDMFSSCGAPEANYVVTVTVNGEVMGTVRGFLLAADADNGGPGSGVFVTNLSL